MSVVNLTPHAITVRPDGEAERTYAPSGQVARVSTRTEAVGAVAGVPVVRQFPGAIVGVPDPSPGTTYLVSALVVQAVGPGRPDVVAPDTSPESVIRDGEGKIVAVRRFCRA